MLRYGAVGDAERLNEITAVCELPSMIATKTQYHLSVDGLWSAGDGPLTGSR